MSFILKVITLSAVLVLASCVKFSGQLKVNKEITIYHESRRGNLLRRILPPNRYPATLEILDNHKALLVFDTLDGRLVDTKMELFDTSRIPRGSGKFFIPSEETAQDYDIKGSVTLNTKESESKWSYEVCHINTQRFLCRNHCDYYGCREICGWTNVRVRGERRVEFKNVTNIRRLLAKLVNPNTDDVQATFKGTDKRKKRHYTYQGQCRY
jgi:hypothetical protein